MFEQGTSCKGVRMRRAGGQAASRLKPRRGLPAGRAFLHKGLSLRALLLPELLGLGACLPSEGPTPCLPTCGKAVSGGGELHLGELLACSPLVTTGRVLRYYCAPACGAHSATYCVADTFYYYS